MSESEVELAFAKINYLAHANDYKDGFNNGILYALSKLRYTPFTNTYFIDEASLHEDFKLSEAMLTLIKMNKKKESEE